MPAFKYIHDNAITLCADSTLYKKQLVNIYRRNGSIQRIRWAGFHAPIEHPKSLDHLGRYAKMQALSVTLDMGNDYSTWRVLQPGQYVVCWLTYYNIYELCVYTFLDVDGYPLVMGNPNLVKSA